MSPTKRRREVEAGLALPFTENPTGLSALRIGLDSVHIGLMFVPNTVLTHAWRLGPVPESFCRHSEAIPFLTKMLLLNQDFTALSFVTRRDIDMANSRILFDEMFKKMRMMLLPNPKISLRQFWTIERKKAPHLHDLFFLFLQLTKSNSSVKLTLP